jgi:hypothetical protein
VVAGQPPRPARGRLTAARATRPERLHEDDFYAWTREQAGALRRLADQRWNGPLDLLHLTEEMEDLGTAARNTVRSQLQRIIEHALSWSILPRPSRAPDG